jgi:hypothetical protein
MGIDGGQGGAFRFTAPERDEIYRHAARQAAASAEHIRRCALGDPGRAADAAWAAADTLQVAARALGSLELKCAADIYSRAARAGYCRIPSPTGEGSQLRAAARLMALAGRVSGDTTLVAAPLIANLVALEIAAAELRQAQQHAAHATAARSAVTHLQAARGRPRGPAPPRPGGACGRRCQHGLPGAAAAGPFTFSWPRHVPPAPAPGAIAPPARRAEPVTSGGDRRRRIERRVHLASGPGEISRADR